MMEIYLITCKINNKFYIGSTSQNKEERWRNQGWSHLKTAYSGDNRPLYKDIRKFGESNFNLSTLEIVLDRSKLIEREDYWIKKYFREYGSDRMYNLFNGAKVTGDGSQLRTSEAKQKSISTKINKYGCAFPVNKETIKRRTETNKVNKKAIFSRESFEKKSTEITYLGNKYYGITEFHKYLTSNGYELSWNQVHKLVLYGFFSKSNKNKYPELINTISIKRPNERRGDE